MTMKVMTESCLNEQKRVLTPTKENKKINMFINNSQHTLKAKKTKIKTKDSNTKKRINNLKLNLENDGGGMRVLDLKYKKNCLRNGNKIHFNTTNQKLNAKEAKSNLSRTLKYAECKTDRTTQKKSLKFPTGTKIKLDLNDSNNCVSLKEKTGNLTLNDKRNSFKSLKNKEGMINEGKYEHKNSLSNYSNLLKTDELINKRPPLVPSPLKRRPKIPLKPPLKPSEQFQVSNTQKNIVFSPSDFSLLGLLGQGSFGSVYLTKHRTSQKLFAMKVLDKLIINKRQLWKYAMAERNILSRTECPFVVQLLCAFQTEEKLFMVIEYCSGGDLKRQLKICQRFEERKAKFYICEIILAIGDLHKNNTIFRDLKPENVVLDESGHIKLTDFGLSKDGIVGDYSAQSFCGSYAYLAPEMLQRKGHGKALDWYLVGILYYELLSGVNPFLVMNGINVNHINNSNAPIFFPAFFSEEVKKFISNLMRNEPDLRLGGKEDVEEVKKYEYFKDINWDNIYNKTVPVPTMTKENNLVEMYHPPLNFNDVFKKSGNSEGDSDSENSNNDYEAYYKEWNYECKM